MKKYTIAILGAGNRGLMFAELMAAEPEKYSVVALCDSRAEALDKCRKVLGATEDMLFSDEDTFFEKKRADALVIATYDRDHVRHAIQGMKLGYDLLLEKPVTDDPAELEELVRVRRETGAKVLVCHELRYVPAFRQVKDWLKAGKIGSLMEISAMERVAYFHFAQAYVRGPFRSVEIAHPLVLAKCSHDLDLLQDYAQSRCLTVSSLGDTSHFLAKNAPQGATARCVDCPHVQDCIFSAKKIYIDGWHRDGEPIDRWPYTKVTQEYPITEAALLSGIRDGMYGTCVYNGKNDVCDRQSVQMRFENGVLATLNIVMAASAGRRMNFFGTEGEIVLDEREDYLSLHRFGEAEKRIRISEIRGNVSGHGGGDMNLVSEFYDFLNRANECGTTLENSMESHRIGIAAEKSRKAGGEVVFVH